LKGIRVPWERLEYIGRARVPYRGGLEYLIEGAYVGATEDVSKLRRRGRLE